MTEGSGEAAAPAPENRRSVSGSILSYSSANLFCRVAAVVQGLIIIRWLVPETLGLWLGLQLILIYGQMAHFGLFNAVNRQVPFHRGRGEAERAQHIEKVVRGALSIICATGLLGIAVMYVMGVTETARGRGVLTLVFVTVVTLGIEFHLGLFRARHEFGRAGLARVASALVTLLGLPLVYYWSFDGLLWRAALAVSVGFVSCIALNRWDLSVKFDRRATVGLIRIGLPILVIGAGIIAFNAMDRTLIALLLDENAMGLYAMCFALASALELFPVAIGQVYYPRMTELYAKNAISGQLTRRCIEASAVSGAIVAVLAGGAFLTMPWIVAELFPKYTAGLPALKIVLISYFLLALATGPTYFLFATVQKRRQLVALVLGMVTMIAIAHLLSGHELIGIAWARVAGTAVYVSGLWVIVMRSRT